MSEREIPLTKYWQMRELLRCLIVIALNIIAEAEKGVSETRIYCLLIRGNHANLN